MSITINCVTLTTYAGAGRRLLLENGNLTMEMLKSFPFSLSLIVSFLLSMKKYKSKYEEEDIVSSISLISSSRGHMNLRYP